MRRREVLALFAAGALPADYKPQFFSPEEHRLLDAVSEMILPADERSPGARAARVADFIDLWVASSPEETKQRWKRQMAAIPKDPAALAKAVERAPGEDGRFFVAMKQITVFAYYTSKIGIRDELGYQGNQAIHAFPGCMA
ncbi:MAG: gluconate 2-dehydrogenase subunit 3 family protein [Acidobacteria bacterium]|nr:gluconate 2-dehydrogenase subunit 3 family protein [Acidobacteriota bacterium]